LFELNSRVTPAVGRYMLWISSSRENFDTSVKITTVNSQFPKIKEGPVFDLTIVAGDRKSAMVNLTGYETGNGGYSQGDT
jgi:hypothetical protein